MEEGALAHGAWRAVELACFVSETASMYVLVATFLLLLLWFVLLSWFVVVVVVVEVVWCEGGLLMVVIR